MTNTVPNSASLLDGFEVVASDSTPAITLDNQRRFYLNTSARRLMDVSPYERLALEYNVATKALAIVKPGAIPQAGDYATSNYIVDKRYYLSARHFSRTYRYEPSGAPYYFDYVRGSAGGSAFVFRLRG